MAYATLNRVRWTREQYYQMSHFGILPQGTRVELLDGDMVLRRAESRAHWLAVVQATPHLVRLFCDTHLVQVRLPLDLEESSQLIPDFALVSPEVALHSDLAPTRADLVIEIDPGDPESKAAIYARSRVPELWVVDLERGRLEVLREPRGDGYAARHWLGRSAQASPLFRAEVGVPLGCFFSP